MASYLVFLLLLYSLATFEISFVDLYDEVDFNLIDTEDG